MNFDYLVGLNAPQREAVLHKDGPAMIIAGAGSGKTKVLTTRIAHLMAQHGVDAFNILALTFTNKAAKEMRERIEKVLGNSEARNLYIGTFHSVFARILRVEASHLGYPNNFTIYDTDDAKAVLKGIINEMGLDDKLYKPNIIYNRISAAKNALVSPEDYAADGFLMQEDALAKRPLTAQIYARYVKRNFKNGAMDFDDLLFVFHQILTQFPEVLLKYQRKFKYIMIDEYQDTNPVQYEIIKMLGAAHENVVVVGDDAQSIYSFRGATIENILQFRKDYEDVKVVKLEQNYRSTQAIVSVANALIKNNKDQIEKSLFTANELGEPIHLVRTMTDNDEGKFVADAIQENKLRNHFFNKDFAILYRTNAQSRSFEEALRRLGIAYRIYGGISFYQRKEVKDFIAYLRLVMNPQDNEALKRIINYPVRGIGKSSLDKLITAANNEDTSLWNILNRANQYGIKAGSLYAIEGFVSMIKMFMSELPKKNAFELATIVGKNTGMVKELYEDKTAEGIGRYENIQELLSSIKEFTETPLNTDDGEVGDKSLGFYLQQIVLLTDADDDKGEDTNVVKLMTVHASKGLEFPVVFVAGLEDGLFPGMLSLNSREELEEERRLFYVAITRAEKKLYLSHSNTRYRFGKLEQNEPSRFLLELPDSNISRKYAGQALKNNESSNNAWKRGSAFERMHRGFEQNNYSDERSYNKQTTKPSYLSSLPPKNNINHEVSENFAATPTAQLQAGQKIEHQKFGFGTIENIGGSPHNPIATIIFDTAGEKKIMLNYAKIMVVN